MGSRTSTSACPTTTGWAEGARTGRGLPGWVEDFGREARVQPVVLDPEVEVPELEVSEVEVPEVEVSEVDVSEVEVPELDVVPVVSPPLELVPRSGGSQMPSAGRQRRSPQHD